MLWATASDSEVIKSRALPCYHTRVTHGKDRYSGVLSTHRDFLAQLEEMLPGEKQAKQNPI